MTGALGHLGAPRQRSAGNLSVALAGPPLWLRDENHYNQLPSCPALSRRLRRCLCVTVCRLLLGLLVLCLDQLKIVAAMPMVRRRPESTWPGFGLFGRRHSNADCTWRTRGAVWQLRPTHSRFHTLLLIRLYLPRTSTLLLHTGDIKSPSLFILPTPHLLPHPLAPQPATPKAPRPRPKARPSRTLVTRLF
ncbi:hypothetical protein F5883DRAFT_555795 [Diaporthe sp. PMI_573]|nr:hypothetical protein F5883DRAFT_555795 [Diaporthaceae sp. PMI_573]